MRFNVFEFQEGRVVPLPPVETDPGDREDADWLLGELRSFELASIARGDRELMVSLGAPFRDLPVMQEALSLPGRFFNVTTKEDGAIRDPFVTCALMHQEKQDHDDDALAAVMVYSLLEEEAPRTREEAEQYVEMHARNQQTIDSARPAVVMGWYRPPADPPLQERARRLIASITGRMLQEE